MSHSSRSCRTSCTCGDGPSRSRSSGTPHSLRSCPVAPLPRSGRGGCRSSLLQTCCLLSLGVNLACGGRVGKHERNREVARTVGPPRLDPKPGLTRLELEPLAAELRADLDPERLACFERQVEIETVERDGVCLPRAQAYVHPFVLRIPARLVDEALLLERPVQLPVDGGESVADERLSNPPSVVVRRLQSRNVLDEVDSEQKRIVLGERSAQGCEEPPPLLGVQVPDRASQEGDQPAVVPGEYAKIAFEVTDDRMHEDPRVGGRDRLRARSQGLLAHVKRDEAFERVRGVEPVQ